jgi:hypothetical protein
MKERRRKYLTAAEREMVGRTARKRRKNVVCSKQYK